MPPGGSDAALSLWEHPYGVLETENPQLVKKYAKLLLRELSKTSDVAASNPRAGSNSNISKVDAPSPPCHLDLTAIIIVYLRSNPMSVHR